MSYKKSIYKRLLVLFLTIVTIYTCILAAVLAVKQHQIILQNSEYLNEFYVVHAANTIDNKINIALQAAQSIAHKSSVADYLKDSSSDYQVVMNVYDDIRSTLNPIQSLDFEIGLTSSGSEFISSNGFFGGEYLGFIGLDEEYFNNLNMIFENDINHVYVVPEILTAIDGNNTIIYRFKQRLPETDLFVFITFHRNRLISTQLPNEIGGFNIWANNTNESFASLLEVHGPRPDIGDMEFENEVLNPRVLRGESDGFVSWRVNSNVSSLLSYVYSVQRNDLMKLNFEHFQVFAFLVIPLILGGVGIIVLATKRSYAPIKMMLSKMPMAGETVAAPENELEFITNTIRRINEDNIRLQENYEFAQSASRENLFKSIIYNLHIEEDALQNLEVFSLEEYRNGGILTVLSIDGVSEVESNLTKNNLLLVRKKLLKAFKHMGTDIVYLVVSLEYNKFCLISPEKSSDKIRLFIEQIVSYLEKEFSFDFTFSISAPVDTIEAFYRAFNEATSLDSNRYLYQNKKIIFSMSEVNLDEQIYKYSLDMERGLFQAVQEGDRESMNRILEEVLSNNLNVLSLDEYNISCFKYALLSTIKRILYSHNKSILDFVEQNKESFRILTFNEEDKLYTAFVDIFESLIHNCVNVEERMYSSMTAKILNYIHEHYLEDLSLAMISNHFGLTEGYISKLLKETADIKFKSYLNHLKMEKAKELLQVGDCKISEVGSKVGYNNVNSFIRVFKRQEGMSPGDYKKINQLGVKNQENKEPC